MPLSAALPSAVLPLAGSLPSAGPLSAGLPSGGLSPLAVALPSAADLLPLLGAVLLAVTGRWLPRTARDTVATCCSGAQVLCLGALWVRTGDGVSVSWLGGWTPVGGESVGIVLAADRIGALAALLAAVLVLAVLAYSWRYFDEPAGDKSGVYPALLLLFSAGMTGFALTGDLFDAFVFFELMGTVAYALTGYRIEDPRPLQGALAFGIVNSLAAYASLLGIGLLYARTGELGLAQLGHALDAQPPDALVRCAFVLVLAGPLVKAAARPGPRPGRPLPAQRPRPDPLAGRRRAPELVPARPAGDRTGPPPGLLRPGHRRHPGRHPNRAGHPGRPGPARRDVVLKPDGAPSPPLLSWMPQTGRTTPRGNKSWARCSSAPPRPPPYSSRRPPPPSAPAAPRPRAAS
ncbi:proton-conducting transporter transmembrane domain-containing protein [Kitasatospora cineracea]